MILTLAHYQTGMYALPHASAHPNDADNTDLIQSFIDRYERELLIDTVGIDLYNDIKANEADYTIAPDYVKDLVLGKEYTIDGVTYSWNGLQNSESLLVPYVYYRYIQEHQDLMTSFGVERPEGVNSDAVSAIPRATAAYRDFFKKYQGYDTSATSNKYGANIIHGRYLTGIDWMGTNSSVRTLYQFLQDNSDVYTVSDFRRYENLNNFGI